MKVCSVYSAGLMSQSFWFLEFKQTVKLRQAGMDFEEIKKRCVEENLYGAAKEYRARRMAGYIISRVKQMDEKLIDLFCTSDLATQKLINLILILCSDRLFFEFVYELYREKAIIGAGVLDDSDSKAFFTKKESQNEEISGWKDTTKRKLINVYINFMIDANLLTVVNKKKEITPPILDIALERYLIANNAEDIVRALTGVN